MKKGKTYLISLMFILSGCVSTPSYKSTILDHSAFLNEGRPVNYTAKEKRVFVNRKEVSMTSDSRFQAVITDFGDKIRYVDKNTEMYFSKGTLPPNSHKDWNLIYIGDIYVAKIIRKSARDGSNSVMLKQKVEAKIIQVDNSTIEFSDAKLKLLFKKEETLPKDAVGSWDELYYTESKRYGIYRNIKKGVYKVFFLVTSGHLLQYEYIPMFEIIKSLSKGVYRLGIVSQDEYKAYDFLPTRNFICADLIKQYASIQKRQGTELAKTVLLGIIQAYTSYSVTTYSGVSTSAYQGVYNDSFGFGSWSGYGTSNFTGYSETYDYSFLGDRAQDLLNIAFSTGAGLADIKRAMLDNGCKCP